MPASPLIDETVAPISPPDAAAMAEARARQSTLTKPPGSLGRLGEGPGAALAMHVVEAAAKCLDEMATFAQAGVSGRVDPEGPDPGAADGGGDRN